ncbi:acyl-CoA synthetase [Piscinibacter sp.]|uniref:LpxL/LpxP family acyltransferase n=1 Tax=Piscinibacter sp. TaxID=1903157 RepID=UPI002BEF33CC|nr:acyl-CoA synthetase [Albitalea sp.]HUG21955.1 acyl-CoA synthetase [Albitalea sp.]
MNDRLSQATASDAHGGSWAHAPERSNALALRLMRWIAVGCGRRVSRWVLHPITLYFMLFAPGPRRHAKRYLGRALGRPARWRDAYRLVFNFTATILDRVYLLRERMDLFDVQVHSEALVDATLAEGRGAFLLGAHMGSFEVLRAVGRDRAGLRIAMVMYPDNARLINAALRAIAPASRPEIIALGRSDSMLAVRDWLDGGGLAGILGDRALPGESARGNGIRVDFLGREAVFSDGPFRLAALLRRRVIFMVGLYLGGNRYDVRFESLADFRERPANGAERERLIREAVRAYASRLEAHCRAHPYNWFNFHDFWHEDPTP